MSEQCEDAVSERADFGSGDIQQLDIRDGVYRVAQTGESQSQARKKFSASDDLILLQIVNAFRPWRAPAGTANGVMKVFDDIATHCAKHKGFRVQKNGPALRTRFNSLVSQFRTDDCKSLRQSGTTEMFEERDALLQQIRQPVVVSMNSPLKSVVISMN
ncbi:hypothetical protein ATCC90586_000866 [Pythium insidiosum]|nr:hypothetical protein ATCC90586_000866 [Pythium insidiosum]